MELRDIFYITQMGKCASISQAAKNLYVPQPTLSNVLKRVELELGKKLFTRTNTGLQLTEAGERFVARGEMLLEMNERMIAEVVNSDSQKKTISVASPSMWIEKILAPVSAEFALKHPECLIEVRDMSTSDISQQLGDTIDLAILQFPRFNLDECDYEEIFEEQILIAISENYWKQYAEVAEIKSRQISLDTLSHCKLILTDPDRPVRNRIEAAFKNNGIPYSIGAITNNIETSLILAEKGIGVAFISDKKMKQFVGRYKLTYLQADSFLPRWQMVVAAGKDNNSPEIQEFRDGIKKFAEAYFKE